VRRLIGAAAFWAGCAGSAPAFAGSGDPAAAARLPAEPWVLVTLAALALAYGIGFARLRRRSGQRIASAPALAAWIAALLVLLATLSTPADRIAEQLFAAHMVQHLTLMLIAAPLLVQARTAIVLLWAIPAGLRRAGGSGWATSGLGPGLRLLFGRPLMIWLWFSGLFVFWHLPGPYAWALGNEAIHVLEHLAFLLSAFAFWSVVIEPLGRRRLDYGLTVLFVATAAIVGSLPGALMILATRPLYGVHAEGAAAWGLTLVQDQQLGGLFMWIPAGFAYLLAIAVLFVRWLQAGEQRSAARLARAAPLAGLAIVIALGGCGEKSMAAKDPAIGNPDRGAAEIAAVGCGSCHSIPGIADAQGLVGPPLDRMGRRIFIAGLLRNTPDNLVTWLRNPQAIVPGNAMPDLGLSDQQARDIAAYLYTLD
jgi:cytochrome c oxidase assembly factor CtaG/cytochrome c2